VTQAWNCEFSAIVGLLIDEGIEHMVITMMMMIIMIVMLMTNIRMDISHDGEDEKGENKIRDDDIHQVFDTYTCIQVLDCDLHFFFPKRKGRRF